MEKICIVRRSDKNKLKAYKGRKYLIMSKKINKDYTYVQQHKELINKEVRNCCTYAEGKKIMSILDKIRNLRK